MSAHERAPRASVLSDLICLKNLRRATGFPHMKNESEEVIFELMLDEVTDDKLPRID